MAALVDLDDELLETEGRIRGMLRSGAPAAAVQEKCSLANRMVGQLRDAALEKGESQWIATAARHAAVLRTFLEQVQGDAPTNDRDSPPPPPDDVDDASPPTPPSPPQLGDDSDPPTPPEFDTAPPATAEPAGIILEQSTPASPIIEPIRIRLQTVFVEDTSDDSPIIATKGLYPEKKEGTITPAALTSALSSSVAERRAVEHMNDELLERESTLRLTLGRLQKGENVLVGAVEDELREAQALLRTFGEEIQQLRVLQNQIEFREKMLRHEENLSLLKIRMGDYGIAPKQPSGSPTSMAEDGCGDLGCCEILPLCSGYIRAAIRGSISRVVVQLEFRNSGNTAVRALFKYELPRAYSLCGLEVHYADGTHLFMQSQESAQRPQSSVPVRPRQMFELGAPEPLTLSVGLLHPGENVTVVLAYVTELVTDVDQPHVLKFFLPATLFPPICQIPDPLQCGCHVDVYLPHRLSRIHSPSHAIRIQEVGPHADVAVESTPSNPFVPMRQDFLLQLEGEASTNFLNDALLEVDPESEADRYCLCLPITQPGNVVIPAVHPNVEVILVVQYTAELAPEMQKGLVHSLQLFVQSMPFDCFFNIFLFGGDYRVLFTASSRYTAVTVKRAFKWLGDAAVRPIGGNLQQPLVDIFNTSVIDGATRHIFCVLISGVSNALQVSNDIRCAVRGTAGRTRVHACCVGEASAITSQAIAFVGEGESDAACDFNELQETVLRQMKCALSPTLGRVTVSAAVGHRLSAEYIPPIPYGLSYLLFIFFSASEYEETLAVTHESPTAQVTVKARVSNGSKIKAKLCLPTLPLIEGRILHTLGARRRIDALQQVSGNSPTPQSIQETVRLAIQYSLLSRHTTCAISSDAPPSRSSRPASIPVELPCACLSPADLAQHVLMATTTSGPPTPFSPDIGTPDKRHKARKDRALFAKPNTTRALLLTREPRSLSAVECFIFTQQLEGYWKLDDEILLLLRLSKQEVVSSIPAGKEVQVRENSWVTCLALVSLRAWSSSSIHVWDMAYLKALRWLYEHKAIGWIELADTYIQAHPPKGQIGQMQR
eukprot:TRINITY_DN21753_c0_g1_i1.p2 TRINITY_DN21753_c0_g1~~TRINITY_DN21753_c0_g1_i1.p2  ORF type:complete len:1067 (+),score=133.92 TRINITY_DN21753_c0_g1_i1:25-3201(+)